MPKFIRKYEMEIGESDEAVKFSEHNVEFNMVRTNTRTLGKAKFSVYNPDENIIRNAQKKYAVINFKAGYIEDDPLNVLFLGRIHKTKILRDKADLILEMECGDALRVKRRAHLNQTFRRNTSKLDNINSVLDAMNSVGISVKNAKAVLNDPQKGLVTATSHFKGVSNTSKGEVVSGLITDIFSDLIEPYDLVWDIQDGELVVSKKDAPSDQLPRAVLLTPDTGLTETPMLGEKNILEFSALLDPRIKPFAQLVLKDTEFADGNYYVTKVTHEGEYRGRDWRTKGEARLISKPNTVIAGASARTAPSV